VGNNGNGGNIGLDINNFLVNIFEVVYNIKNREFEKWQELFKKIDINPLHLVGSGPAVYYISDSDVEVKNIINNYLVKFDNLRKYIAKTVPWFFN
jgi:hypothetical protein